PIVVNQCVFQQSCSCTVFSQDCANQNIPNCMDPSVGCDLTFDPQFSRSDSLFGIANLTGSVNFARWMRCRTNQSNRCGATTLLAAGGSDAPLTTGVSGNGPVGAMNATRGNTLIVPVFSDFTD